MFESCSSLVESAISRDMRIGGKSTHLAAPLAARTVNHEGRILTAFLLVWHLKQMWACMSARSCAVKLKAHNARRARPRGAAAAAPPPPPAVSRKRAADAGPVSGDYRAAKRAHAANPARTPRGMHEAPRAPHEAATDAAALVHLPPLLRFKAGPRRTRAERKPVSPTADAAEALLRLGGPSSGLARGSPAGSPSSSSPASGSATLSTKADPGGGSPAAGASFAWSGAAAGTLVGCGSPGSASPVPAAGWAPAWAGRTLEALLGGGCTGAGDPPDWVPAAVAAARAGGGDLDLLCGADAVALQLELLSQPGAAAEAPPCVLHFEAW